MMSVEVKDVVEVRCSSVWTEQRIYVLKLRDGTEIKVLHDSVESLLHLDGAIRHMRPGETLRLGGS